MMNTKTREQTVKFKRRKKSDLVSIFVVVLLSVDIKINMEGEPRIPAIKKGEEGGKRGGVCYQRLQRKIHDKIVHLNGDTKRTEQNMNKNGLLYLKFL